MPRSTSTPSPATTPRWSSSRATRTGRRGSRPGSTAGSRHRRLVTEHRGLLGYTGTVDGVPVSVQTTMMGTPTTTIVMEELLMLGVTTFIRVGTTGGYAGLGIGDAVVALAAAGCTGVNTILGGGEPTAPTADFEVVLALRDAALAEGLRDPRRARS